MTFPAGSGSAVLTASGAVPNGVAGLNLSPARTVSMHRVAGVRAAASSAPYTTTAYITLTASSTVALSGIPTITVSTPAGMSGAYYNSQGFWVTLPQSGTFALASGVSAYFAVYSGGTLPSPNPDGCVGVQPDATTRTGAHAALVGVQPITSGATFSYTGTLTQTIARATPCAMPTSTSNATVSVAVTMTSAPGGADEHSVENDNYSTNTVTTSTDAIVEATAAPAAQSFAELSETTTDEVGDSTVTTYGLGALVYAVASPLPFMGTITNNPPSTVNATLADGTTTKRTYNTDGSYTETDTIPGGSGSGTNTIAANSNFSGSYTITSSQGQLEFAFSAPSGGVVNLTESLAGTTLGTLAIPQWWTGTSLYSDTTVDNGETTGPPPAPCNPIGPSTSSADDFQRTISIVDPALGYTENETIDSYVVKNYAGSTTVGPACVVIKDVQNLYYDYFYDTTYTFYGALGGVNAPLQTDTINEAYWYSGAPTGDNTVRTLSANPGGVSGLSASIAAHASGIAFARATQRAKRIENIARGAAVGHLGGLK
jgi:hypothetical protein